MRTIRRQTPGHWILVTSIAYLIVLLVVLYWSAVDTKQRFLDDQARLLNNRIGQISQSFRRQNDDRRNSILFLSQLPPVSGIARARAHGGFDPEQHTPESVWIGRLTTIFRAYAEANPDISQVRLIGVGDGGRELIRVNREGGKVSVVARAQLQQKGDRPYVIDTLALPSGQVYASEINLNQELGTVQQPPVAVSRYATPIRNQRGQVFGLVVLNFDESERLATLAQQAPPQSMLYALNGAGDFIVHPDLARRFGSELGSPHGWEQEFGVPLPRGRSRSHAELQLWRGPQGLVYGIFSDLDPLAAGDIPDIQIALTVTESVVDAAVAGVLRNVILVWAIVGTIFASLSFVYVRGRLRERRIEGRFRIAVETSTNAMIMVDRSGTIMLVNPKAESLFGYTRSELEGQSVERLVPASQRAGHVGLRNAYQGDPSARPMGAGRDLYGLTKDGRKVPIEIGLSPNDSDEGQVVFATITDISVRKRTEAALAERTHDLEQFAYVASHDLQEPLRGVSGCLQLLEKQYDGMLDEKGRKYISLAVSGAERMHRMINDLLDYSRIGRLERRFKVFDCELALNAALRDLQTAISETDAEITHDPLPSILGDQAQFHQLFQNLVGNAIKFRSPERQPKIRVSVHDQGDAWTFSIQDNGIGIDPRFADQVFGVFRRLHTAREYPGSGIGLATCKKIVEAHGGRIWVEKAVQDGANLTWIIPKMPRAEDYSDKS